MTIFPTTMPTGIEAAKIVADYLQLRGVGDEDDAANIIYLLHRAGVVFKVPDTVTNT